MFNKVGNIAKVVVSAVGLASATTARLKQSSTELGAF